VLLSLVSRSRYTLTTGSITHGQHTHRLSIHTDTIRELSYLVTIAPLIVLGADVLVGVLSALLQRRHVAPVLPMLLPEIPGVGTSQGQARNNTALYSS
jgi:hypothetical protein